MRISTRKRSEAIRHLLNAAKHLREQGTPSDRAAIKQLLELSVKVLGNAIYMEHGLRIDRDRDTGHLILLPESKYHATNDGKLVRLEQPGYGVIAQDTARPRR